MPRPRGGTFAGMWDSIKAMYADAAHFARAAPLAFLLPVVVEFAQHVAEVRASMYLSRDAAQIAAGDPARLAWGYAKTLALLPAGYWFVRWLAWGDARRAWRPERPAIGLFAVQALLAAGLQYQGLFGTVSLATLVNVRGQAAQAVNAAAALVQLVVGIYLTAWLVAWPLGHAALGPIRSIRIIHGSFWRTVGYLLAGALPLMALHYAFGLGAIGRPAWLVWPMLALDAGVVGLLALTLAGANYLAARDAAARRGVPLAP